MGGHGTVPAEAWDRTHPDHEWWVNGRGWCYDAGCLVHAYGPENAPADSQLSADGDDE